MLNYGPVSRSADSSERTAAASRQQQRGDSRLGSFGERAGHEFRVGEPSVPLNLDVDRAFGCISLNRPLDLPPRENSRGYGF